MRSLTRTRRSLGACLALVLSLVIPAAGVALDTAPAGAALSGNDDMVYAFGSASFLGSTQGMTLASPIVGMAQTANGAGYWLVAADGGVFGFNAPFFGSAASFPHAHPVVAMGATADGGGYWIVTDDGAVYSFGTAQYYGGLTAVRLSAPITDLIPTATGHGYWLIAKDGGVFSFGDAGFYGSTGGIRLNAPVVSMAPTADGAGYWLVADDGGVFSFGNASFHGSTGGMRLNAPVIGMASSSGGAGYWLVAEDGGVFSFGSSPFLGSAVGMLKPGRIVTQLRGMPGGDGYRMLAVIPRNDVAMVGMGASGPGVTDLQLRLEAQGYWTGGANGVFGPLTQQAVWAFQKVNGLPRSGVVDDATRDRVPHRAAPVSAFDERLRRRGRQGPPGRHHRQQRPHQLGVQHLDRYRPDVHVRGSPVPRRHPDRALRHEPPDRRRPGRAARHALPAQVLPSRRDRVPRLHRACRPIPRRTAACGSRTRRSTSSGMPTSFRSVPRSGCIDPNSPVTETVPGAGYTPAASRA